MLHKTSPPGFSQVPIYKVRKFSLSSLEPGFRDSADAVKSFTLLLSRAIPPRSLRWLDRCQDQPSPVQPFLDRPPQISDGLEAPLRSNPSVCLSSVHRLSVPRVCLDPAVRGGGGH